MNREREAGRAWAEDRWRRFPSTHGYGISRLHAHALAVANRAGLDGGDRDVRVAVLDAARERWQELQQESRGAESRGDG